VTLRRRGLSLDPRTKLLILVLINVVVFVSPDFRSEGICMLLIAGVLLLMGAWRQALWGSLCYAAIGGLFYLCGRLPGMGAVFLSMMIICFRRVMPMVVFASGLIATTRVGDLISALQRMGIPKVIIIPFAVTLRFFPTVKEEFLCIRDAMKLRGIRLNLRNLLSRPLTLLECILVPMMLRCANIAEELSAAAVTRGIECEGRRTSLRELRFRAGDAVSAVLFSALSAAALLGGIGIPYG
jgi:energy-coupling factor transport system permease protein